MRGTPMDWVYVKKWFMPNDIRHLAWSYTPLNTVFKIYIAKSNESINILFIKVTLPTLDEARAKIVCILRSPAQNIASILLAPASKIAILALEKSKK